MEVAAALAGSYYLKKQRSPETETRIFVYYLWLVVFVETVGFYPAYAYFTNYETLPFIRDTLWQRNFWWYNSYHVLKYAALFYYFIRQLSSKRTRRFFYAVGSLFLLILILYFVFSGEFFLRFTQLDFIGGTVILMILILFYYYELLRSDRILGFYKNLPFYVSLGLLGWHLLMTPIFIYNNYFSNSSPDFLALHSLLLKITNVFLYGMFIAGFIICSRNNTSGDFTEKKNAGAKLFKNKSALTIKKY